LNNRYTININSTINSGQSFLWEKRDKSWYGIYEESVLKITEYENNGEKGYEYDSFPKIENWQQHVFRFDDKYDRIMKEISGKDSIIDNVTKKYLGLRIMRQRPIQCIISFLCSSNNNIPRIRLILRNLSKKFGKKVEWDGNEFYTFPSLLTLHTTSVPELLLCGLGYRAEFVIKTVREIVKQEMDMVRLAEMDYDKAKQEILKLSGVGDKIADCILLFSLNKLEAFPIDTWIIKFFQKKLNQILDEDMKIKEKITPNQYRALSKKIREHYGRYSGYAQQYLYYSIREENGRKW
jgi:N-glycosylase/DNA lyase